MSLASGVAALAARVAQEFKAARSRELLVQTVQTTVNPHPSTMQTVTVAVPVPLNASRGWVATVHSDAVSTGSLIAFRVGKQRTGTVDTVAVSFLSLNGDFPATSIDVVIIGYPAA